MSLLGQAPIKSDIETCIGIAAAWRVHEDETTYKYKMRNRGKEWVVSDIVRSLYR